MKKRHEIIIFFKCKSFAIRNMKKIKIIMSLSLLSLPSCTVEVNENVIYTSCYSIYDFTKRIVGDKYEVRNLLSNGVEPHDYEMKIKDATNIISSKAFFINSLGLEVYESSLLDEIKEKTYIVTDEISTLSIENVVDPHVWLSIKNAKIELKNILSYMKEIDYENYSYYESNYEDEIEKFDELDYEYESKLKTLKNKYLVVSHAAFTYLCNDYGLNQIYISGLSFEDEPSAKDLEKIMEQVKKYKITTIFDEEKVNDEIASRVAKETGVKVDYLNTLESPQGDRDYISYMRENLNKIVEANND